MKETEKNVTTIQVTDIITARTRIDDLNQVVGAKEQTIRNLQDKIAKIKDDEQTSEDSQPKVLIVSANISDKYSYCPNCEYRTNRSSCPNCGEIIIGVNPKSKQYLNMEDVKIDLKKEIASEMKNSVADLQDEVETLKIDVKSSKNELKRERKNKEDQILEAKSRARDRYNKLIRGIEKANEDHREEKEEYINNLIKDNSKTVNNLTEELDKIENDKTDKELEAKRKKEIADLIEINGKLEIKLEQLAVTGFIKRAWAYVINKDNVRKEAIQEHQEMKDRVEEIVSETRGGSRSRISPFWF